MLDTPTKNLDHLPYLPSVNPKTEYNPPKYPLWVHEDIIESLERYPHLRKRLSFVLAQLASRGCTTITKSCNPPNQGWRRSPMGGAHGNQFYLWWCASDARPMKTRNTGSQAAVWIRAIRIHHDHGQLGAGDPETQYIPLTVPDVTDPDSGIVENPRTHTQQDFVQSTGSVQIIRGHPGSGKTTTLWHAIEARENQNVLYVTWSPQLAHQAGEHFGVFAPQSCQTLCMSYLDLLTAINGVPTEAPSIQERLASLQSALTAVHAGPQTMGPWLNNLESLYAEIRGQWLGRSVLDTPGTQCLGSATAPQTSCLTPAAYLKLRQPDNQLGAQAAMAFIGLAQRISNHPIATQHLQQALPDITAANTAISRLRAGSLPPQLGSLNQIAVDEVQDLSITEFAVITELVKALALNSRQPPKMLIAGDEAQTVQPSGFEWNALRQHLETSLAPPQEYILDTDARAPAIIADAIAKTNDLYSTIGPNIRPADRRAPPAGDAYPGTVIIAVAPNTDAINLIIPQLAQQTELALISPTGLKPAWLHADVAASVLTPQQAKGTEHRTACVLLAGQAIANIRAAGRQTRRQPVETIMTRASIDLLRVSMSRATENLILLETSDTWAAAAELFDETPIYDAQELTELVHQEDAYTLRLITDKLQEARTLADTDTIRAWNITEQAHHLRAHILEFDSANEAKLQRKLDQQTISAALRVMTHPDVDRDTRNRAATAADAAVMRHPESRKSQEALKRFYEWASTNNGISAMLDSLGNAPHEVAQAIQAAIASHTSNILDQITLLTADPDRAMVASNKIEQWTTTLQLDEDDAFTHNLHRLAFQTLVRSRRFEDAESVLSRLPAAEHPKLLATVRYHQNRWTDALQILQLHGLHDTAADWSESILLTAMDMATRKYQRQQYEDAVSIIHQALEIQPHHRKALELQIRTFHNMPDYVSALAAADQLLQYEPTHLTALHIKALLLAMMGKIDNAIITIQLAVAEHPNSHRAQADHALMLANANLSVEALQPMELAIALSEKPDAYYYGTLANIHTDIYTRHTGKGAEPARLHREAAISAATQSMQIDRTEISAIAAILRLFIHDGYRTFNSPPPTDELYRFAKTFRFLKPIRATKKTILAAEDFANQWELMIKHDPDTPYTMEPQEFNDLWDCEDCSHTDQPTSDTSPSAAASQPEAPLA